jgi:hypothetical protein
MKLGSVFALVVAACAPESSGTVVEVPPQPLPSPPPADTAPAAPVAAAPAPMRSDEEWIGTYRCAQGETDLDLRVDRVVGGAVEAVFQFSHAASGASGAYEMHGTLSPDGRVALVPGRWLSRPPNYVSVGMHGEVRGDDFTGRIDNPTCGAFRLRRR